ncbi:MAG: hypothetical protein ACK504_05585 [Bacteroidota bacterium]
MIPILRLGKIKFVLLIISIYITSCSNTFSRFSKFNNIEKNFIVQFINNQIELNFSTNRIYIFYNNIKEKPSENFYSTVIKKIADKNYKILALAESSTAPFYSLIIQVKEKSLNASLNDTLILKKRDNLTILSKHFLSNGNEYVFSLVSDENKPKNPNQPLNSFNLEFGFITSSVKFSKMRIRQDIEISGNIVRETPLLALKLLKNINLDSVQLDKADYYLQIRTMAWNFLDEQDSVNKSIDFRNNYFNKRINKNFIETNLTQNSKPNIRNDSINYFNNFLEDAKNKRVVIINESHEYWKHRYNASIIIDSLYQFGYEYIALEALLETDTMLNERKYPLQQSGYFISEPYFGNLIRKAAKKGFLFIPYESISDDREKEQAKKINDFLINNPNKKLIIYCGWAHISQSKNNTLIESSMTNLLENKYKIPILTLNQTQFLYNVISNKHTSSSPFFITNKANVIDSGLYNNDYYIINYDNFKEPSRMININTKKFSKESYPLIIKIYNSNEYFKHEKNAVPLFVKYIISELDLAFYNFNETKHIIKHFDANGVLLK